jgi:hypothetical protein
MEGEPHLGVVKVPDERIDRLAELYRPRKVTLATIEYIDYLGLTKGDLEQNLRVIELVKDVDILVENFSPRVMPTLGLDYKTPEKLNPKLVMTSISNFGQTGPYRDYKASELIIYGMGGANIWTAI